MALSSRGCEWLQFSDLFLVANILENSDLTCQTRTPGLFLTDRGLFLIQTLVQMYFISM